MTRAIAVILLAGLLAACTTTRAHVQPEESPTLVVPPVPPRVIEPLPTTEPPVIPPVADLPGESATPERPRPPREPNKHSTEPKPEVKPETPPDPVITQPPPTTPVPPRTGEAVEAARQIREVLDRAARLLNAIRREGLSQDRQANFDAARNFLNQAEEALKKNDLVLAKNLADRAEQIAKLLSGRNAKPDASFQLPAASFE